FVILGHRRSFVNWTPAVQIRVLNDAINASRDGCGQNPVQKRGGAGGRNVLSPASSCTVNCKATKIKPAPMPENAPIKVNICTGVCMPEINKPADEIIMATIPIKTNLKVVICS